MITTLPGPWPGPPPRRIGEDRQATLEGAVGGRRDGCLLQHRRLSSLLAGSMIRASTSWRNTSSPPVAWSNPSSSWACARASTGAIKAKAWPSQDPTEAGLRPRRVLLYGQYAS